MLHKSRGSVSSHMEDDMHRVHHLALGIVGLMLLVGVGRSWAGPPNNDVSDALGNTAGGTSALQSTTTGGANTAFGARALQSDTDGQRNTAVGNTALTSNTSGVNNTATGVEALSSNTTGAFNTASGVRALSSNTSGSF